ncbi:MAG: LysE family translocator [Desulfurococcales archaeon]|nr:LysE family translocator [Desulfurococcales archaeon]
MGFRSNLLGVASKTLLITPSGALSPGPLSAVAVAIGASMGLIGGLLVALGHMIVEMPYVYVLVKSYSRAESFIRRWRVPLNTVVVVFLVYFAYLLLRDSISMYNTGVLQSGGMTITGASHLTAIAMGMLLTGTNAYFLAWWITVGYPLIEASARNGRIGLTVMYTSHVWMDYAWLALLAWGGGASRLLGVKPYAALLGILGLILLFFAARIALDTYKNK